MDKNQKESAMVNLQPIPPTLEALREYVRALFKDKDQDSSALTARNLLHAFYRIALREFWREWLQRRVPRRVYLLRCLDNVNCLEEDIEFLLALLNHLRYKRPIEGLWQIAE